MIRKDAMIDLIISGLILLMVGLAIQYIYKEKKKGVQCIGCPNGANCSKKCSHLNESTLHQIRSDIQKEKEALMS